MLKRVFFDLLYNSVSTIGIEVYLYLQKHLAFVAFAMSDPYGYNLKLLKVNYEKWHATFLFDGYPFMH